MKTEKLPITRKLIESWKGRNLKLVQSLSWFNNKAIDRMYGWVPGKNSLSAQTTDESLQMEQPVLNRMM